MRGRDVHDACGGRQEIHDQALVIDGYANDPRAESAEQARRRHIPGVLDRDAVAGLEQDPGDQVDGMLGAAGDDDRVSPASTDRDRATQPAMARRNLILPAGSPYSRCSAATAAATRRRHIAAGNSAGSERPGRRSRRQPYGGGRKYGDQPANLGLGRRAAAAPAPLGGAGDADATTLPPPARPSA